jgi:AcrR family transcriptional regulator
MPNTAPATESDGRKQRTNDSRLKIVEAMLQLIREGNIAPSAEQVASKAQVGLRTVFRRFNEMELLFRELASEIHRTFAIELHKPILGDTWQEKLLDVLDRKLNIYETVRPFREAAKYHMHTSEFIQQDAEYWQKTEKVALQSILPSNVKDNMVLFNALKTCLGYEYWLSLHTNNGLSKKQIAQTMTFAVTSLLKQA